MSYEELALKVKESDLYKRTYWSYAIYFILVLLGIMASLYCLTITDNLWWQLLNAVFLAFVSVQAGMIGHDLSHNQVFESKTYNHIGGVLVWGLLGGVSEGGWYDKHTAHHKYVNHEGLSMSITRV